MTALERSEAKPRTDRERSLPDLDTSLIVGRQSVEYIVLKGNKKRTMIKDKGLIKKTNQGLKNTIKDKGPTKKTHKR